MINILPDLLYIYKEDVLVWLLSVRGTALIAAAIIIFKYNYRFLATESKLKYFIPALTFWAGISGFSRVIDRSHLLLHLSNYSVYPLAVIVETLYVLLALVIISELGYNFYKHKTQNDIHNGKNY